MPAARVDAGVLSGDAELAGRAANGDQAAFEELFRRHVQAAWRFAQAVTTGREEAERAVEQAYIRVLRVVRRGRSGAAGQFHPYLLAAVHRTALDALRGAGPSGEAGVWSTAGTAAPGDGTDQVAPQVLRQAFGSLPQRWRAALWLIDVEGMAPGGVAPILGVSATVTTALVGRARSGLAHRFDLAGCGLGLPDVPATLREQISPLPAGLAQASLVRWKQAMAKDRHHVVAAPGWLADRAQRPLAVGAAGLLALGLIGLGVIGQQGGFGGGAGGSPLAVPLGNHQFNGPPGASLDLAGSVRLLSGPDGLAGALFDGTGLAGTAVFIGSISGSSVINPNGASSLLASGPGGGLSGGGGGLPGGAGGLPPSGQGAGVTVSVGGANACLQSGGSCNGAGAGPVQVGSPPSTSTPGVGVTVPGRPPITVPVPPVTAPPVTRPPVTLPHVTLPPTTLPPTTLPHVTLPPTTLPHIP
jgi:DNA-directed RNA polymerase specialized sigma24 family protein